MKSYTDLEQSKKLAEILPPESADMFLALNGTHPVVSKYIGDRFITTDTIPCWSLAALIEVLPDEIIDDNGDKIPIDIRKYDSKYLIAYRNDLNWSDKITTDEHENLVDAAVEMIVKLHKEELL